jgi:hypothetical protein
MQPLSPIESSEVLADLLHRHGLAVDAPMADWCLDVASGNPFFIHSLVLHYAATREVRAIPEALGALLRERLELISRNARHVFAATAVLARHSTLENIESVVGLARHELLDALQSLAELGFVKYGGARVTATHALLSDLALAAMPEVVRRLLHRNAAQVLAEVAHAQTSAAALWDAAEHWLETGDGSKSADALRACARHALEIGQPVEAVRALQRAAVVAPDASQLSAIRCELLVAAEIAGEWRTVLEVLPGLRELEPGHGGVINLERLELEALLRTSSDPRTVAARLTAYARNESVEPRERLRACTLLVAASEDLLSEGYALDAAAVAQSVADTEDLASIRREFEIIYHASFGDLGLAVGAARWLRERTAAERNFALACRRELTAGGALLRAGLIQEGAEALERCYAIATDHRLTTFQHRAATFLAGFLRDAQSPQAFDWQERAERAFNDSGQREKLAGFFSNCAMFAIDAGDLDLASAWVARAFREVPSAQVGVAGLHFRSLQLRLRQLRDSYDCSDEELSEMLDTHIRYRTFGNQDEMMESLWHALARKGRTVEADALLQEYVGRHRRIRCALPKGLAQICHVTSAVGATQPPP